MRLTEKQAAGIGRVLPKRKYRNKKVTDAAGQVFDSRKEHKRFRELQLLEAAGVISDLRAQVEYELIPKQRKADGTHERAVKYIADFVYQKDGGAVVEDVKSVVTRKLPAYILKRKLMLQKFGIEIKEI